MNRVASGLTAILLSGTTPVQAQTSVAARPASAFADSIGLNIHLSSEWDTAYGDCANGRVARPPCAPSVARIGAALNSIGVRYIRDGLAAPYVATRLRELADIVPDLRLDFIVNDDRGGSLEAQLGVAAPVFDLVNLVEGPNEPNNSVFKFRYNKHPFPKGAIEEMHDLGALLPHTALAEVPIANIGLGGGTEADPGRLGVIPEAAFATAHAYYGVDAPKRFSRGVDPPRNNAPGRPMLITETGNCTPAVRTDWCAVSEPVQAKYTLMALADAFQIGIVRTYLYELVDEKPDPSGSDSEQHFGLFYPDWSPKPAGQALINLHNELGRGGQAGGTLGYDVNDARSFLLRRDDGVYLIVAWFDAELWDSVRHTAREVAPVSTVLKLGKRPASIELFNPLDGSRQPLGNSLATSFNLLDHPVVIEVRPE